MKKKISISMDEDTIKNIDRLLKNSIYRNKSHLIEIATKELLEKNDRAQRH